VIEVILAVSREVAVTRSMAGVRIFLGIWFVVVVGAAIYFIRHRKRVFGGRSEDATTDSPAAGNLRMWMVILILLHAAVILFITILEL
jgi:NADH:ubiquinone oxidoreductase subunit 5 (subunit L)/multisubunit Na+/H+ antiporter MnhA subunit